jgi:hypothetical protein
MDTPESSIRVPPDSPQAALARFLVENGALDPRLYAEFTGLAAVRRWAPLGSHLVRLGFLTLSDLAWLLALQAADQGRRIGDLAVEQGLCTPEQVRHAIEEQARTAPGPLDLLVGDPRVDQNALLRALVQYVHFLEGRVAGRTASAAGSAAAERRSAGPEVPFTRKEPPASW